MKHFVRYIIVTLMFFTAAGCRDEFMKMETTGEGEAKVSATLDFKPMSSALARTRAAGNALKDIASLHVLLYNEEKNLIKKWKIAAYDLSEKDRTDEDAENKHSAETSTKRAIWDLPEKIGYGRYYMYVVANLSDLFDNNAYAESIKSVDGLKNISFAWDSKTITNNGQMLGYCTNTSAPQSEDEPFVINEKNVNLHAWLRRAASKVTVAFDGSDLKEGVSIYLKALRIKNIPKSCKLGADNTVESDKNLIPTGEEVVYSESRSYDANYPALITKELPCYPRVQKTGEDGTISWVMDPDRHSETNPHSLFFYENMQGSGPDKPDKSQSDANKDGILDNLYPYKDMPYATYIEVDAYYESTDPVRPGICNITYRFMLGQNVTTDYDAKRNCHYKLTLHFNGYADDPDWRIDYVTRLWATQPETADYRGKYFVPNTGIFNYGNKFSADNTITVTSFMYKNDDWYDKIPIDYKIEYRDAGSAEFSENPPSWLGKFDPPTHEGNGVYKLKIKYNNPYTQVKVNDKLSGNPTKGTYDLATKGGSESMNTANCYIVDSRGTYRFPLVYGNAITEGSENTASYTYQNSYSGDHFLKIFKNYKNQAINSPYILDDIYGTAGNAPANLKASLVWQDAPSLVTDIQYVPGAYNGKGGIQFTVNNIQEGNAVIAIKDQNGAIMWSWHIWVTAIDLSRKITLTNANVHGNRKFEIMPVNLGWCSGGIPVRYYDRHECEVRFTQYISGEGQEGLSKTVKIIQEPHIALPVGNNPYFQWGRKDPFVAGGNANKSTKTWYDAGGNTKNTAPAMMYTALDGSDRVKTNEATASLIQNPDKWQNGPREETGGSGQPYRPKDMIYFNLWDNSCWDDNDDVVKTVYDPCPAGYHVSSIYTFSGFTNTGNSIAGDITNSMYAATEENMMPESDYKNGIFEFYTDKTKLISIGFPTNGYRDWDDNANLLQYGQGEIWHAQAWSWIGEYNAYYLEFTRLTTGFTPHIWPSNNFYATDGFPVRPSITLP